jgi:hypothetical protein
MDAFGHQTSAASPLSSSIQQHSLRQGDEREERIGRPRAAASATTNELWLQCSAVQACSTALSLSLTLSPHRNICPMQGADETTCAGPSFCRHTERHAATTRQQGPYEPSTCLLPVHTARHRIDEMSDHPTPGRHS